MGLVAQKTSPSPRPGHQGFTSVNHLKNRLYDYPKDQSPGVKFVRLCLLRISPVLVHGFKISPSPVQMVARGCPMHMEAR